MPTSLHRASLSLVYQQQTPGPPVAFGPQDGGFDTSGWGNYGNYYPMQNQHPNPNQYQQVRPNDQRPRPNQQNNQPRQQAASSNVVVGTSTGS